MAKKMAVTMKQRSATPADVYVGERIREARNTKGMSQAELGKKLGVSFQQVQKYEKGLNRVGGNRLNMISAALDKPMAFFFPTSDDVRTKADPALTRFISTKEGLELARNWFLMSPAMRDSLLGVVTRSAKAGA